VHRVKGMRKRAVVEGLAGVDLAASVAEVLRPPHGHTRVEGLRLHDGWSCNVGGCTMVSTSHDAIRQHCSRVHRLNAKAAGVVSRVKLQTLFREHPQYFIVTVPEVDLRCLPARQRAAGVSPPPASSSSSRRRRRRRRLLTRRWRRGLGRSACSSARRASTARRATPRSRTPSTSRRSRRGCGGRSSTFTSAASTRRPSRRPTSYPRQPTGRRRWP